MTYIDVIETSHRSPIEELDGKSTASGSSVQEQLTQMSKDLSSLWRHLSKPVPPSQTADDVEAAVRKLNMLLSGISGAKDVAKAQAVTSLEVRAELKDFLTLGFDWDGHGAKAISPKACVHAWRFLRAPLRQLPEFEPYPEPDGSVGLEYHKENKSLYLSFAADRQIAYVLVVRKSGAEEVHRGRGVIAGKVIPVSIRRILDAVA